MLFLSLITLENPFSQSYHRHRKFNMGDTNDSNDGKDGKDEESSSDKWTPERLLRMLIDCIVFNQPLRNIQTLLRAGTDANGSLKQGLRPLHYAAFHNRPDAVYLLVRYGADVNKGDNIGYTPLHIAAKHGFVECAIALMDNGAVVNYHDENSVNKAEDDSKVLALLTVHPLNLAIENNHAVMTELLLQRGADPNQKYFLGHEISIVPLENNDCLQVLLSFGADPDSYNRSGITTLMKACKQDMVEAAKTLLLYGADVNKTCHPKLDQKRALHYAVMKGNIEMIKILLDAGADTRQPEEFRFPPLEFAVAHDKLEVCKVLLEYGADPNEVNGEGCTSLQIACSNEELKNKLAIIKALLENGADPCFNSPSFSYINPCLSPLIEYLSANSDYDLEIVRLMFQYGAELNLTRATARYRILDKFGIVSILRKVSGNEDLLFKLLEYAGVKNREQVRIEGNVPPVTRAQALESCVEPTSLKHQCRITVRRSLHVPKPRHIDLLPLPAYVKEYLLFNKG